LSAENEKKIVQNIHLAAHFVPSAAALFHPLLSSYIRTSTPSIYIKLSPHFRYNTSLSSFIFRNVCNSTITWDCVTKYKDLWARVAKLLSPAHLCYCIVIYDLFALFFLFTELKCQTVHGAGVKMRPKCLVCQ
jgi:branched-subunit amino acid permease